MQLHLTACVLDTERGTITQHDGTVLRMTTAERSLLAYLGQRLGEEVSLVELHREVWGHARVSNSRAAQKAVARLRKKIEVDPTNPEHLQTVYGIGFRLTVLESVADEPESTSTQPTPAWPPTLHGILPTPLTPLNGRGDELARLRDATERILVISGCGGIGKTRLAIAHGRRANMPVLFGDLSTHPLEDMLHAALGDLPAAAPALLVLDHADDALLAIADRLPRLLEHRTALQVLITTRVVPTLRGAAHLPLGGLSPYDASRLFRARAEARRPGLLLDELTLRRLVRDLGGHPLAIEMAAEQAGIRTLDRIRVRAQKRPNLTRRGATDRHASLESVLETSLARLPQDTRRVLQRCSVFRGDFTLDDAERVITTPDLDDQLEFLVEHSLIEISDDGWFTVPRVFGALSRAELPEDDPTPARHADRFHALGAPASNVELGPRARRRLWDRVAACEHLLDQRDPRALDVYLATDESLVLAGEQQQIDELASRCLRLRAAPEILLTQVRLRLAVCRRTQDDPQRARALLEQALFDARELGDQEAIAYAQQVAGLLYGRENSDAEALAAFHEALQTAKGAFPALEAAIYSNKSLVHHRLGQLDEARTLLKAALSIYRALDDRRREGIVLHNLGTLDFRCSDTSSAMLRFAQALELHRVTHNEEFILKTLRAIANAEISRGELDQALTRADQAVAIATRLGFVSDEAGLRVTISNIHQMRGAVNAARSQLQQALALQRQSGDIRGATISLNNLGRIWHLLDDVTLAKQCFTEALTLHGQVRDPDSRVLCHGNLGRLLADIGEAEDAAAHLDEALATAHACSAPPYIAAYYAARRAVLHAERGALGAARADIDRAHDALEGLARTPDYGVALCWLARAAQLTGEQAAAQSYRDRARHHAKRYAAGTDIAHTVAWLEGHLSPIDRVSAHDPA